MYQRVEQRWLIYPLFAAATREFIGMQFEAVKKYGFIVLEGNMAVIFARLEEAYDPRVGAGRLWPEFLLPMLPYCFFAWAIVMLFRLVLPWAASFGGLRAAWKVAWISVSVGIAGVVFQRIAVRAFRLDEHSAATWVGLIVVALMFSLYLRQALQPVDPGVECQREGCQQRNPKDAMYCAKCGTRLGMSPVEARPRSDVQP